MGNQRFIILVSGWATSGKDVFSDFLVKSANFKKFSIASPLKLHTSNKYDFDYNLTLTQSGKSSMLNKISIRNLLIKEATLLRNIHGNDIFIEKLTHELSFFDKINDKRGENCDNIVISDFRYVNEFEFLKRKFNTKIITVKINRYSVCPMSIESEHQLNDFNFDYIIDNHTSILDFENNILDSFYFLFN